jgi:hypothetical protein
MKRILAMGITAFLVVLVFEVVLFYDAPLTHYQRTLLYFVLIASMR